MALDGLLGDVQHRADLVVGVRFGHELEDLLLARSQQLPWIASPDRARSRYSRMSACTPPG